MNKFYNSEQVLGKDGPIANCLENYEVRTEQLQMVKAIEKTGKVDHKLCISYSGANPLMAHLLKDRELKEKFSFETIINTAAVDDHGNYSCNLCLKVCRLNNR